MGNACAACLVNGIAKVVLWTGKGLWLLTLLGFKTVGVAAGSLAAAAMSFTGNVSAASTIAQATSRMMRA